MKKTRWGDRVSGQHRSPARVNSWASRGDGTFVQIVLDDLIDISVGQLTRDDGLDIHTLAPDLPRVRTRLRNVWK